MHALSTPCVTPITSSVLFQKFTPKEVEQFMHNPELGAVSTATQNNPNPTSNTNTNTNTTASKNEKKEKKASKKEAKAKTESSKVE